MKKLMGLSLVCLLLFSCKTIRTPPYNEYQEYISTDEINTPILNLMYLPNENESSSIASEIDALFRGKVFSDTLPYYGYYTFQHSEKIVESSLSSFSWLWFYPLGLLGVPMTSGKMQSIYTMQIYNSLGELVREIEDVYSGGTVIAGLYYGGTVNPEKWGLHETESLEKFFQKIEYYSDEINYYLKETGIMQDAIATKAKIMKDRTSSLPQYNKTYTTTTYSSPSSSSSISSEDAMEIMSGISDTLTNMMNDINEQVNENLNNPYLKCSYCNGTGTCKFCVGTGEIYGTSCWSCKGTGLCTSCDGDGNLY